MRDYINHSTYDDEKVNFTDGILYIISRKGTAYSVNVISIIPDFDNNVFTLKDIERLFPNVIKVIHEMALMGAVYNYGNHIREENSEKWEKVGMTAGYS